MNAIAKRAEIGFEPSSSVAEGDALSANKQISFEGIQRVLKSVDYRGWICVDLDTARKGPRISYERCGAYVVDKLEPIYA